MKLASRVGVLAVLCALAVAGLKAPGLAGQMGVYVWLGVFPGMAVARLLLPRSAGVTRATLGMLLSPLVSALAGWALARAGFDLVTGARLIGVGGWILYAGGEARSLGAAVEDDHAAPLSRFAWIALLASVVFVALPPLFNAWIRIRSDTWVHGAIVEEILRHGFPPMDPRFIGLRLNYVWIFHLFIAQLVALRGQDAFVFMSLFNVVNTGVMIALVWQLARAAWDDERAARGTLMLFTLGLNAGAWLLWPLNLLRALTGEVRGAAEVRRIVAATHLGSTDVLYVIAAPYTWMVQFWDKVTIGTPLGYGYLFLLLHWWSLARWWRGDSRRWLVIAFVAGAGSVLFHSVVALGMMPVSLAAFAIVMFARRRQSWWPAAGPTFAYALALTAGFAVCLPYLAAVASGWRDENSGVKHQLVHVGVRMAWTMATALGVTLLFAVPGARRAFAERRPLAAWLSLWALGLALLAVIVHLPEGNEHKFVWEIFAALALVGGAEFLPRLAAWRARLGRPAFALVFAALFLVPSAAFLQGYLRDPARHSAEALNPAPGERAMWAWLRTHTEPDDVLLEDRSRDLALVLAGRRMIAGTVFAADRAAFPVADLARRRAATADLYGPLEHLDDDLATLTGVVLRARQLQGVGTLLALYRDSDYAHGLEPWRRLEALAGARAERRYAADGFRIYALALTAPAAPAAPAATALP